jgi:N-methylhydantoinase A
MGTDADAAAEGVIAVANAAMEGALRVISVERGYDPADFTLVCFGGAAGLHAADLAEKLDVARVLVPAAPGVLSAWGMLVAPVRKDASRTVLRAGTCEADVPLDADFASLEDVALAAMREEGVAREDVVLRRRVDARYRGQSFELTVDAPAWVDAFHSAHEQRYGYATPGAQIEAVTLRVEALAPAAMTEGRIPIETATGSEAATTPVTVAGRTLGARLFARADLSAGERIAGPAVVTEYSSTLWIPPGWTGVVDAAAAILVTRD